MHYPLLPNGQPFEPDEWELLEERRERARGHKHRDGWSLETVYRHKQTDE